MKKFILLGMAAAIAITASAQLTVTNNGQTIMGEYKITHPLASPAQNLPSVGGIATHYSVDTLASAVFLSRNLTSLNPGNRYPYFTFGSGKRVWIGERVTQAGSLGMPMLHLEAEGGLEASWSGGSIFQAKATKASGTSVMLACVFTPKVKAPEFVTTSDSRLKKNVESIENLSSGLSSLRPVSYQLLDPGESAEATKASAATQADTRKLYGFIAQEVREIYPDLVVEDEDGMLGISYDGFIPLLVDAYKNLEARVAEQEAEIARLSGGSDPKRVTADARMNLISEGAYLMQNRPNPFKESTEIRCSVPEGISTAAVYVYDLQGKQVICEPVTDRGETAVTIEGSRLQAGMYIYALITDGVEIDSKRMILTE